MRLDARCCTFRTPFPPVSPFSATEIERTPVLFRCTRCEKVQTKRTQLRATACFAWRAGVRERERRRRGGGEPGVHSPLLRRFAEIARKERRHWPRLRSTSSFRSSVGLEPSSSACWVCRRLRFTAVRERTDLSLRKTEVREESRSPSRHRAARARLDEPRNDNRLPVTLALSSSIIGGARERRGNGRSKLPSRFCHASHRRWRHARTRPTNIYIRTCIHIYIYMHTVSMYTHVCGCVCVCVCVLSCNAFAV